MDGTAVPVMWAGDLAEVLDFYRTLGYKVTHEQASPYMYGAVAGNGYDLNLFRALDDKRPAEERDAGCLVFLDEVEDLHRDFSAALKERFGRVPARGIPRITRFRTGQGRFTVVDPAGNSVTYLKRDAPDVEYGGSRKLKGLQRIIDNASILRFSKQDDEAARKTLESGLRRFAATATPLDKAHAMAELVELAVAMEDPARAAEWRSKITALDLSAEDRAEIAKHLQIASDLQEWLADSE
ncbi:VOC family protein [Nocardia altamirensis]|uniref:VOC family protein n=1 Tax=Nocardia altamirensis TaxID=472158 RepID=UPI00083FF174|nr:VOC family protein [Nocardia altamirensis]